MGKNSAAKLAAVERYNQKNYTKITVRVRKDEAAFIRAAVGDRSMNGFIIEAIREKIEREAPQELERIPYFD